MSIASALEKYESIVIVHPDLNEEAVLKLQTQLGELVTRHNGQVLEHFPLGKRKLSYKIGKLAEGNYLQLRIQMPPSEVAGLKKALTLMESIVRSTILRETVPLREIRPATEGGDSRAETKDIETE